MFNSHHYYKNNITISDEEYILDLIERFNFSTNKNIKRSSLEVLATYGNKGIDAITELLDSNPNNDLELMD